MREHGETVTYSFSESVVEDDALTWQESAGWHPDITSDTRVSEHSGYSEAVLAHRLRRAMGGTRP